MKPKAAALLLLGGNWVLLLRQQMLVLCTAVWGRHEGLFELMTSLASRSIWPDVSNEGNVRKP